MNKRRYLYVVGFSPNVDDTSKKIFDSLEEFRDSDEEKESFKELVSDFDENFPMDVQEIITSRPKWRKEKVTVEKLAHESVQISVKTWELARVSAIIVLA